MKCLIISGGDYYIPLDANEFDYIIVCDKGYQYALKDQVRIDLLLGDFDSYSGDIDETLNIRRFKPEKDDTDTMLAIKEALDKGYKDITICSCFGGRIDHLFANIQSAGYIAAHGGKATLISQDTEMHCLSNANVTLKKKDNYSLSLFALSNEVTHLSIKGAKYEAQDITLTNEFPLGQSNDWKEDQVQICCEEGILLIICSSKQKEKSN